MLTYHQFYYSITLSLMSIAIALFGVTRWRLRHIRPTAATGSGLLWCGAAWMLTNALTIANGDVLSALSWKKFEYLAIAPIPLLWLILALQFTGRIKTLTPRRMFLLNVIPVLCLAGLITNESHGLFIANISVEFLNTIPYYVPQPGILMILFYLHGYLLVIAGVYIFTRELLSSTAFRLQASIILVGGTLTIGAHILDWSRLNPIPSLRLTPLALSIVIPLFAFMLIRLRRADIVPAAQSNIVRLMQDPVILLDVEGRIVDLNPAAEQMIGQKLAPVLGLFVSDAWPEWAAQVDTLSRRTSGLNEIRIGPSGQGRVYDVRRSDLIDRHGQKYGYVMVFRDNTERARIEETLRLSEQHFRALTENASDIVVIVDSDAKISYASPSIEKGFGFKISEIVNRSAIDFIHPEDVPLVVTSLAAAVQQPGVAEPLIARFRQSDGHWRKLECVATNLLHHPAVRGIVVNARDVTEREMVAEALRQSEEKYRLHFAHISDVIYSFDSNLRIVAVSPSVERVLGYKPEALQGLSLHDLGETKLLSPETLALATREASQVLNGRSINGSIYEFVAADGAKITAEISSSPIYQDNRIIGLVGLARDITERMRIEERMRTSLQEKDVLLREIHHRVKNNLQIVASLLNLQAGTMYDAELRSKFQDSQDRIRSMALIHERLYRSENLALVSFGPYLNDLTTHMLQSYSAQDCAVELKFQVDDIYLDIDTAVPCGLLVSELVSNALKHAFRDGTCGVIGVEMRCARDDQYQLSVWDDGVGFPLDFDCQQSSSLGLQLVNGLTNQLGGTIEVSKVNGTRFTIWFPRRTYANIVEE